LAITTVVTEQARATMHLRGEMDVDTARLFCAVLDNQLALGRHFVRVDLSGLGLCDCAGLQAIIDGHNRCLAARGALTLTGVTPRIARLLSLTHLDEALIVDDGALGAGPGRGRGRHLSVVPAE
jgi:anti-sigma B factor antagonist